MNKGIKCLLGMHKYKFIKENGKPKEVGVISKDNPYASMGQMMCCWIMRCKCGKAQAGRLKFGKPYTWANIIGYSGYKEIKVNDNFKAVIDNNTPLVSSFYEEEN